MPFNLRVGDIVAATSLALQLITGLQDNLVLERYSEETPVYFAVLVEVKDLMAASPKAIPASARAALELCERRQSQLLSFIKRSDFMSIKAAERFKTARTPSSFGGLFPVKTKTKLKCDELERMLNQWKSSVMLLRELTIDSITHNLLHRASSLDSQSPLPPSGSVTADKASISVTIDAGIKEERQCWMAAKGSLDTQGAGVWITRDLISRAGLLHKIRPLEQKAGPFIDFAGKETWATHCIKLIWFPNQSSKTHETTFLVSESGPFDVLFGRDYMDRLNGPSPILALVPGHKKKSDKKKLEEELHEKLVRDDREEDKLREEERAERERQREKMNQLVK